MVVAPPAAVYVVLTEQTCDPWALNSDVPKGTLVGVNSVP